MGMGPMGQKWSKLQWNPLAERAGGSGFSKSPNTWYDLLVLMAICFHYKRPEVLKCSELSENRS